MALNDLTPQLRTRLSRLERVVGWFVTIATVLLLFGLAYYVYTTAQRKGWFQQKVFYYTFVRTAAGLKVGDPVRLMGRDVGDITEITPMPPDSPYNMYLRFRVREGPSHEGFYGYLWEDSKAKIAAGDFLGNRYIEVTKGTNGFPTYMFYELRRVSLPEARDLAGKPGYAFSEEVIDPQNTNILIKPFDAITPERMGIMTVAGAANIFIFNQKIRKTAPTAIWDPQLGRYKPFQKGEKGYWLEDVEPPPLADRMEKLVNTVESALPSFLGLTNRLFGVLTNADALLVTAKPILTNFATITANLSGPKGSLGEWLLPTNINAQLNATLGSANSTLNSAHTNLDMLSTNLIASLIHVSDLTSNLASQVQANGLILTEISTLVTHTDEVMQGLKRHWLLKSAFSQSTNAPIQSIVRPRIGNEK